MGVKNFNAIAHQQEIVPRDRQDYAYVIGDLSNLCVMSLFSVASRMKNEEIASVWMRYGPYEAKIDESSFMVEMCIADQADMIIRRTVDRIMEFVNDAEKYFGDTLKEIILITDPPEEYVYKFPNSKDALLIGGCEELLDEWKKENGFTDDDTELIFNAKQGERERRREMMKKTAKVVTVTRGSEVHVATDDYEEFKIIAEEESFDPDLRKISKLLYHSLYFVDKLNLLSLAPRVHEELMRRCADRRVKIIESESEADLCLKAYYIEHHNLERTLVISADTDYWFIFGDCEAVDVVSSQDRITNGRNAFSMWSDIFMTRAPVMLRMYLSRLSALIGNDYTLGNFILDVKPKNSPMKMKDFTETVRKLFNISSSWKEMVASPRSNLGYIARTMARSDFVLPSEEKISPGDRLKRSFTLIDQAILSRFHDEKVKTGKQLFDGYLMTILIHMNFMNYVGTRPPSCKVKEIDSERFNFEDC